jgi:hypothetical protein
MGHGHRVASGDGDFRVPSGAETSSEGIALPQGEDCERSGGIEFGKAVCLQKMPTRYCQVYDDDAK